VRTRSTTPATILPAFQDSATRTAQMMGIRGTIARPGSPSRRGDEGIPKVDDEKRIDSFDDLFEPFDLDEPEEGLDAPEPGPPARTEAPQIVCPSCGTHNPNYNRHCEACGARLTKGPLPVAPPPLIRATPGSRALGVLAGIVLVVALGALVWRVVNGGTDEAAPPEDTTTTTSTTAPLTIERLQPFEVAASSELNDTFAAANLIDANPENSWNDKSQRGSGAELTFRFAQPVQIVEIEVQNLTEPDRFRRNYRVQGYQITTDDLPLPVAGVLENTNEAQKIRIASLETTELTFTVTSTYPAEATPEGLPPFNELAIQEFRFYGQTR
jgi:hypothetical protein